MFRLLSRQKKHVLLSSKLCSSMPQFDFTSSADQITVASQWFLTKFVNGPDTAKRSLLVDIAQKKGVDAKALNNALVLYKNNHQMAHEVRQASTPVFHRLLQSVGNQSGGVRTVCEIRKILLKMIKQEGDKSIVNNLRRLDESAKELLTTWFCLSNLKLERLTWQSPGDILQKIAEYEAVHPVRGLMDFRKRVGKHRRCYYFSHAAMPREPLVMVHVALWDDIADSVQKIMNETPRTKAESSDNTAIYYSITSTQKGLSGIDLGNLLIKEVASHISAEVPSVKTHSTLSPIPGLRAWLLRSLRGHSEFGNPIDERDVAVISNVTGRQVKMKEALELLHQAISNERITIESLEPLKEVLLRCCVRYLVKAKRGGHALNPVANFHLRNGAELYRINWGGDTSVRGMANSLGLMVNYRYYLDRVHENSHMYTEEKNIATSELVSKLL